MERLVLALLLLGGCASPAARKFTSGDGTWTVLPNPLINWHMYDQEPESGTIFFESDWQQGDRGSYEEMSDGDGEATHWKILDGELQLVTETFEWSADKGDPGEQRHYSFTWETTGRESFDWAVFEKDSVDIGTESTEFISYSFRRP